MKGKKEFQGFLTPMMAHSPTKVSFLMKKWLESKGEIASGLVALERD